MDNGQDNNRQGTLPTDKAGWGETANPLHCGGTGNILGAADELLDLAQGKRQSEINALALSAIQGAELINSCRVEIPQDQNVAAFVVPLTAWTAIPNFRLSDSQLQTFLDAATRNMLVVLDDKNQTINAIYGTSNFTTHASLKSDANPLGIYMIRFDALGVVSYYSKYETGWLSLYVFTETYGRYTRGTLEACIKPTYIADGGYLPSRAVAGAMTWHAATKQAAVYDGAEWRAADGQADVLRRGATAQRPTGLTDSDAGLLYYDTTLGKPIWWNGSGWTDSGGAAV